MISKISFIDVTPKIKVKFLDQDGQANNPSPKGRTF